MTFRSRVTLAISAKGWMVPISLLAMHDGHENGVILDGLSPHHPG